MMENVEEVKRKKKEKESHRGKRYGFEVKFRCVKLRLEEGLPVSLLSKEVGVGRDVIYRWVKAYQERGEAGLRNQVRSLESRRKLPGPVREIREIYRYLPQQLSIETCTDCQNLSPEDFRKEDCMGTTQNLPNWEVLGSRFS